MESPDGPPGIGHCMRSFEPYIEANHRVEKPVVHISLNPSPKDNLTDEQPERTAQEYLEKLGCGNRPYIIYKWEAANRFWAIEPCVSRAFLLLRGSMFGG